MRVEFYGERARVFDREPLIAGTVGKTVDVEFSDRFEDRPLVLAFRVRFMTRDVILKSHERQTVLIPWEVMKLPVPSLQIGVESAVSEDDVLRSEWCELGPVWPGAEPGGDEGADPTLEVWQQILALMGSLEGLETEEKDSLVAAINEIYNTGGISAPWVDTIDIEEV